MTRHRWARLPEGWAVANGRGRTCRSRACLLSAQRRDFQKSGTGPGRSKRRVITADPNVIRDAARETAPDEHRESVVREKTGDSGDVG
jgi:hypothetical protein